MANDIFIKAKRRTGGGTSAARRLRREGWLPAALNRSTGKTEPIMLDRHEFENLLHHHTSEQLVLHLKLEEDPESLVLMREVQHHVRDNVPLHADFQEISMTERMEVSIPIALSGEPVGVSQQGGVLEQLLWEIEVECLPGDIVEEFSVDVSGLKIGDMLTVEDLSLGDAFKTVTEPDADVATVVAPRLEEEEGEEGEEAAEGAEPEVIGKGKEEESEE